MSLPLICNICKKETEISFNFEISEDSHEDLRKNNNTFYELKTISMNDLFTKFKISQNVDYLSIDTEGAEYEILNSFSFDKYNISSITVEHNITANRERIHSLLTSYGYKRVLKNFSKFDDWYIKNS